MSESFQGTELTCQQIIDFVMAYLEGELPLRERTIFERHLLICPDCVNYLSSYQATVQLEKASLAIPQGTSALPEELVRAVLAARASPREST